MRAENDTEWFANDLDCDIYRLITRAEQASVKDKYWSKVAVALRGVRPLVRAKMSARDRAQT